MNFTVCIRLAKCSTDSAVYLPNSFWLEAQTMSEYLSSAGLPTHILETIPTAETLYFDCLIFLRDDISATGLELGYLEGTSSI